MAHSSDFTDANAKQRHDRAKACAEFTKGLRDAGLLPPETKLTRAPRRLIALTVDDDGTGLWDYDVILAETLSPAEQQRLADLVRRLLCSIGYDVRLSGIASPPQ